jgi:hypothetical protein
MTETTDLRTAAQLLDAAPTINAHHPDWGAWRLEDGALTHPMTTHPNGPRYYIVFDRVTTSAHVLAWVLHIDGKGWGDPIGLLHAFADILGPTVVPEGPLP